MHRYILLLQQMVAEYFAVNSEHNLLSSFIMHRILIFFFSMLLHRHEFLLQNFPHRFLLSNYSSNYFRWWIDWMMDVFRQILARLTIKDFTRFCVS